MPDPVARVQRVRIDFRKQTEAPDPPVAGAVRFYVNDGGDLVRIDEDGSETTVGGAGDAAAALAAHEADTTNVHGITNTANLIFADE